MGYERTAAGTGFYYDVINGTALVTQSDLCQVANDFHRGGPTTTMALGLGHGETEK